MMKTRPNTPCFACPDKVPNCLCQGSCDIYADHLQKRMDIYARMNYDRVARDYTLEEIRKNRKRRNSRRRV